MNNTLKVGILCTFSPLKYGVSRTGKTIYLCRPLSPTIPPVKMAYGGKLRGKIVVVFRWCESDSATLYHVIGVAGPSTLTETLMYHHGVFRKELKDTAVLHHHDDEIQRRDLRGEEVFSIDPVGCQDIDDAFSITALPDHRRRRLMVHIAQPICWLTKQKIIDRAKVAFSTLYIGDKTLPLWSREVERKSSLLRGEDRYAYTVVFEWTDNDPPIVTEAFPSIIRNRHPTHYDDTEYPAMQTLLAWTRELHGPVDTHEMVSYWMVQTNQYVGQTYKVPYRVQDGDDGDGDGDGGATDDEIQRIFRQYTMDKAVYSMDRNHHASLNRSQYTHFTSPIRRIMDCLLHWRVTYGDEIEWDLDTLNSLDQQTKRFHRDLALSEKMDGLEEGRQEGYLYEKITRGVWRVYFRSIGFQRVVVVHEKMEHLIIPEREKDYVTGGCYLFDIYKREGFMPRERVLITPSFSLAV